MIGVQDNVAVDDQDGGTCNVNSHSFSVIDSPAVLALEGGRCKHEVGHEEAYGRLVDTVEHIEPSLCKYYCSSTTVFTLTRISLDSILYVPYPVDIAVVLLAKPCR